MLVLILWELQLKQVVDVNIVIVIVVEETILRLIIVRLYHNVLLHHHHLQMFILHKLLYNILPSEVHLQNVSQQLKVCTVARDTNHHSFMYIYVQVILYEHV